MKLNILLQHKKTKTKKPGVFLRERPGQLTVENAEQTAHQFLTHMMDDTSLKLAEYESFSRITSIFFPLQ